VERARGPVACRAGLASPYLFKNEGRAMKAILALLITASTLLGGCVVAPYDGGYYGPYGYGGYRHHEHHWHHGDDD